MSIGKHMHSWLDPIRMPLFVAIRSNYTPLVRPIVVRYSCFLVSGEPY